jgi:hypothetical protein
MNVKLKVLVVMLIILSLGLAACSDSSMYNMDEVEDIDYGGATGDVPELMELTGPGLSIEDPKDSIESEGYNVTASTVQYVGSIDANSIEVYDIDYGEFLAIRLTDQIKEYLESFAIESGDTAQISYYIDENGDYNIVSFSKKAEMALEINAIYTGLADSNSIEVRTSDEGEVIVFRLSDGLKDSISGYNLDSGSSVKVTYFIDENGVRTASSITVSSDSSSVTVTFIGQIDQNSIEVKYSDGSFAAFRFSDEVKEGFEDYDLNEGDEITVEYYTDENGSYIITGIS